MERLDRAVNVDHSQGVLVGDHGTVNNYFPASRPPATWPMQLGAVPPPAHLLQARQQFAELNQLEQSVSVVVLSGLGGVGKTQIAAHHARQRWTDGQLDLLVWINAGSPDSIRTAYATAASAVFGVDVPIEQATDRWLGWLASTQKRWLVVFDDLQLPGDLQGLWPPQNAAGRTLITTRYRGAALDGHQRQMLGVDVFTPKQAVSYLTARLARPVLLVEAADLAADLGHLPLALAQASAYIIDQNLPADKYRALLSDQRTKLVDLIPTRDELPDDHQRAVDSTWALSISLADRLGPTGLASRLLDTSSMLDPNGIPQTLYATEAVINYLSHELNKDIDPQLISNGLQVLHRLNLVSLAPEADAILRVHKLVQRAVRENQTTHQVGRSTDSVGDTAWALADALTELWPDIERDHNYAQLLRANSQCLVRYGGEYLWEPDGHPILFRIGRSLGEAGLVEEAKNYFDELKIIAGDRLGPDHRLVLSAQANSAMWRAESGDAKGAIIDYERLLAACMNILGPDDFTTLMVRHNLAFCKGETGDLIGSIGEFEQLLIDRERVIGADHPSTLSTRHCLAAARADAGDLVRAEAELERLIDDQMRTLGPDDPATLAVRLSLAETIGQRGSAEDALTALEGVVVDSIRILGPDHPDTLGARNSLAGWRAEAGDVGNAVTEYETLLRDEIRVLGPDHPHTITTRHNIASWNSDTGSLATAITENERILADRSRVLGADHPKTLITRSNLAHLRAKAGNIHAAITEYEHLLSDRIRVLGKDHPDTLLTRHNLAGWRAESNKVEDAVTELQELLADEQRILGIHHPYTLVTQETLTHFRESSSISSSAISTTVFRGE